MIDRVFDRIKKQYAPGEAATPSLFRVRKNRREHLRSIQSPEGRRAAALVRDQRRVEGRFVLGGLRKAGGRVTLWAVGMTATYSITRDSVGVPTLIDDADWFYRWRTRQAATQFRQRWGLEDLHVYDLDFADVLPAELPRDQCGSVDAEATSQVRDAALSARQGRSTELG